MANDKDPKIVPGEDVNFTGGEAQADSLDATVADATPNGLSHSWMVDNMNYLAEQIWPAVEKTSWVLPTGVFDNGPLQQTPLELKQILPYWAFLKPHPKNYSLMGFQTRGNVIKLALAKPLFEAVYGDDLKYSGLYDEIGFEREKTIIVQNLGHYFPELERVLVLDGRANIFRNNPYLVVLSYPIEARPLLTGTLRQINPPVNNNTGTVGFVNSLTTRDILAYARTVGELPRVKDYLELMQKKEKPK